MGQNTTIVSPVETLDDIAAAGVGGVVDISSIGLDSVEVLTAARRLLVADAVRRSLAGPEAVRSDRGAGDPGPAIVASLVLDMPNADEATLSAADRALTAWLSTLERGTLRPGTYGDGLAGRHIGLLAAAHVRPGLRHLATASRRTLVAQRAGGGTWRTTDVSWADYDLVVGPAGMLLAMAADPDATAEDRAPLVSHLVALCDRADLGRLRAWHGYDDRHSWWNRGRITLGVARGVSGVALALCAAAGRDGAGRDGAGRSGAADNRAGHAGAGTAGSGVVAGALRTVADWLVSQAERDGQGAVIWSPAACEERSLSDPPVGSAALVAEPLTARQAWCYGTPGVSWTLWETGRILGDADLQRFSAEAFGSFLATGCRNVNVSFREGLALCHGDAGLLVLCDAFARHAGLVEAGVVRELLAARLRTRLPDLGPYAESDRSLLTGSAGILAALLTADTGDRGWLSAMGVR